MKSFAEIAPRINPKELSRKDAVRRACIKEFTKRLNDERHRENESKIQSYMWGNQVNRAQAIKVLMKEEKSKKIWPLYTERAIHFKTIHLDTADLRDFLDMCNRAEKDGRSFGKTFSGSLKIR